MLISFLYRNMKLNANYNTVVSSDYVGFVSII